MQDRSHQTLKTGHKVLPVNLNSIHQINTVSAILTLSYSNASYLFLQTSLNLILTILIFHSRLSRILT